MPYIAAFDIGKKNFAFAIEYIEKCLIDELNLVEREIVNRGKKKKLSVIPPQQKFARGKLLLMENIDLTYDCDDSYLDPRVFINMTSVLDERKEYWDKCDIILIEQQMSFGRRKTNTMALKLGQHCYSYFSIKYGDSKELVEFPAYHKTQVLRAPKKFGKIEKTYKNGKTVLIQDNLKKWSVRTATSILEERGDKEFLDKLNSLKKKDDASDCVLMIQARVLLDLQK